MMEMCLFDRLTVSLERFCTAISFVFAVIFEEATLEGFHYLRILCSMLYKCALLFLDVLSFIMRHLAHFFYSESPAFHTFRDATRVYLKLDTIENAEQRHVTQSQVWVLQERAVRLTKTVENLSGRLSLAESRTVILEAALAESFQAWRQRLLPVFSENMPARPLACFQVPASQVNFADICTVRSESSKCIAAREHNEHNELDRIYCQLLVNLLLFRRSVQQSIEGVTQTARFREESSDDKTAQYLLIELLNARRTVRKLLAEKRMQNSLAIIIARTQRLDIQRQQEEHDNLMHIVLTQLLTFRKSLLPTTISRSFNSRALSPHTSPSVDQNTLIAELESLRLSEAQARIEKDSMATSLSDVLASLPIEMPYKGVCVCEEPTVELVLALTFLWKSLQHAKRENHKRKIMKITRRGEPLMQARFKFTEALRHLTPSHIPRSGSSDLSLRAVGALRRVQHTRLNNQQIVDSSTHLDSCFRSRLPSPVSSLNFPPGNLLPSYPAIQLPQSHNRNASVSDNTVFRSSVNAMMSRGGQMRKKSSDEHHYGWDAHIGEEYPGISAIA